MKAKVVDMVKEIEKKEKMEKSYGRRRLLSLLLRSLLLAVIVWYGMV